MNSTQGTGLQPYNMEAMRFRHIVPFELEFESSSFEEVCNQVDCYTDDPYSYLFEDKTRLGKWNRASLKKGEQDVFDYIIEEFNASQKEINNKAGCFWEYEFSDNKPLRLYYSTERSKKINDNTKRIFFDIVQMGLYVFRTGIGILWYEIEWDLDDINNSEELIHYQSRLKELNMNRRNHLWVSTDDFLVPKPIQNGFAPFLMGNWIAQRLNFLNATFPASRPNVFKDMIREEYGETLEDINLEFPEYCPDKSILFNYVIHHVEQGWEMDHNAIKTAYCFTKGYSSKSKIGAITEDNYIMPFSNVVIMAGEEGCGYYAWLGAESKSTENDFFREEMKEKIINDYFLLYIRVLYQSYSLRKYAATISEKLPNSYSAYTKSTDKNNDLATRLSTLIAEISLFKTKGMIHSVSFIQHQNDFYLYLLKRLNIEENASNMSVALQALDELQKENLKQINAIKDRQRDEEQRAEYKKERKADSEFQFGLGLMTLVSAFTAIEAALNLYEKNKVAIVLIVIIFIIFIKAIKSLIRSNREIKNLSKNSEQPD